MAKSSEAKSPGARASDDGAAGRDDARADFREARAAEAKEDGAREATTEGVRGALEALGEKSRERALTVDDFRDGVEIALQWTEHQEQTIRDGEKMINETMERYQAKLSPEEVQKIEGIRKQAIARLEAFRTKLADLLRAEGAEERYGDAANKLADLDAAILQRENTLKWNAPGVSSATDRVIDDAKRELAVLRGQRTKLLKQVSPKAAPDPSPAAEASTAPLPTTETPQSAVAVEETGDVVAPEQIRREQAIDLSEMVNAQRKEAEQTKEAESARVVAPREFDVGTPEQPVAEEDIVAETTPAADAAIDRFGSRQILNAVRIREQFAGDHAALEHALAQAKYAERRGVYEDGQLSLMVESAIRGLSGEQRFAFGTGEAALGAIAAQVGLDRAHVQGIFDRQRAVLEDRARRDVLKESRDGMKTLVAKGGIYAGLGVFLNRFIPGLGAVSAAVRMADTWTQGTRVERSVQERIAQYQTQLAEGMDGEDPSLTREFFADIAAEIAGAKQSQIDRRGEPQDISDPVARADAARGSVAMFLAERYPELSSEQHAALARGAGALAHLDTVQRQLEVSVESQFAPGTFGRTVNALDKFFGSRIMRGGESGKERTLTAGVFALAGVLAREVPVLRNVLFGYTGLKIGEAAGMGIVNHAGRYEILKPISAKDLAGEIPPDRLHGTLAKARFQLADAKFRNGNPAEAARIRELVDRHEERLITSAETGASDVAARTDALREGLVKKWKVDREAKVVVNGTRIAGAALGAVLGPMAVEWITKQFERTPAPAEQPKAAAPVEVASPPKAEVDPKMLDLARIHRGDGATQVFQRQLEANPSAFGYDGDPAGVKSWALAESKRIAIEQGYLGADGRTTALGLRFKEGAGLLLDRETGTTAVKPIGNIESYIENRALGFGGGGGGNAGGDIPSSEYPDSRVATAFEGAEREHIESVVVTKGEVAAAESAGKSEDWVQWDEGTASTGAEEVTATPRGVDVAGMHIEFADSISNADRAHTTQFIEFERAKTDAMKKILEQYQKQYGDRSAFNDFANGVKRDIALSDGQVKNVIDAARTGELGGRVKAAIEATGNFSPAAAAKMEIDVVALENNLLSSDERSRDAFADLDAARRNSSP